MPAAAYVQADIIGAPGLSFRHGIIFGLLGANGAGKSSTIKMLTTLLPPTGGSARVAGHDVCANPHDDPRL